MELSSETITYTTTNDLSSGAAAGIAVTYLVVLTVVLVVSLVSYWKIYKKAGKPGWAAIVPIYNIFVLLQIVKRPTWWILLFFIPFVNIVAGFIIANDLAKAFGKGMGMTLLLIFLPIIGYPMLAFGKATYGGGTTAPPAQTGQTPAAPTPPTAGPVPPVAPTPPSAPTPPAGPSAGTPPLVQ